MCGDRQAAWWVRTLRNVVSAVKFYQCEEVGGSRLCGQHPWEQDLAQARPHQRQLNLFDHNTVMIIYLKFRGDKDILGTIFICKRIL